jgi:hypothetical protein
MTVVISLRQELRLLGEKHILERRLTDLRMVSIIIHLILLSVPFVQLFINLNISYLLGC